MITRQDAIKVAAELNLPEVVQRLARGETLESRLDGYWGNAEEFFLMKTDYGEGIFVPLWDDGNFDQVVAFHLPTKKFFEFDVETEIDFENLTLWNYQQILYETFRDIYEVFYDDGEERCRTELNYHADLFEFNYVDELMRIGREVENFKDWNEMDKVFEEFRKTLI
ncbi:MAG TPA: hypothetical protein VGC76_17460 [Pyrinomonadaceae bacterium]|jgi:hypothetical protein